MRNYIKIILAGLSLTVVVVSAYFLRQNYRNSICAGVEVRMPSGETALVSMADIEKWVYEIVDSLHSMKMRDIPVDLIEKGLENNLYLQNADVFLSVNRRVVVKADAFTPIVHVLYKDGEKNFFLTKEGYLIPYKAGVRLSLPIANGTFNVKVSDSLLNNKCHLDSLPEFQEIRDLFVLAASIDGDEFVKSQIDQIYRNPNGDFELVPKIGKHVFLLGEATRIQEKMEGVKIFYNNIIKISGWEKYRQVNLKFSKQIVCS